MPLKATCPRMRYERRYDRLRHPGRTQPGASGSVGDALATEQPHRALPRASSGLLAEPWPAPKVPACLPS